MNASKARHVFPGGNTAKGFFSFYDQIIPEDSTRIFLIKGGPGVGKSTFMKYIAKQVELKGLKVEYHHCSSDPDSLDAIVIPKLGIAMMDATAPHIVDPKNPGVVDEIINLGNFWDESNLSQYKKAILNLNKEIGENFKRAYFYLAQCQLIQDELHSYYQDSKSINTKGLNKIALDLMNKIFVIPNGKNICNERHLFANAITPQGTINYLTSIFENSKNFVLTENGHFPNNQIVQKLYQLAQIYGYDVEVFHCALTPTRIEHLFFPELNIGIITSRFPHTYEIQTTDEVINIDQFVNPNHLAIYKTEIEQSEIRFNNALNQAISFIKHAKIKHDILEKYYIESMDFTKIDEIKANTLSKILSYV